jgi:hypothetical protein
MASRIANQLGTDISVRARGAAECRAVRRSAARQTIIQIIRLIGRQPGSNLAHGRNDGLRDITAGAPGSTSQQISHRSADLRLSVFRARKLPIVLI